MTEVARKTEIERGREKGRERMWEKAVNVGAVVNQQTAAKGT